MMKVNSWIQSEEQAVLSSRALTHDLLESQLPELCRDSEWLRASLFQMYHVVLGFPFHIAGAVASCRDERVLRLLVINLYAEVGGESEPDHISLFRRLLKAVGIDDSRPSLSELWPETIELEKACDECYRSESMGTKLGSLFAFEAISSPMVEKWSSALRNTGQYSESDFEFFTIHIEIEKDHVDDIKRCCENYMEDPVFMEQFSKGALRISQSLEMWWDRMLLESDRLLDR